MTPPECSQTHCVLHRKAILTCKTRVELDVGRLGGSPRRPSEKCSTVGLFCMAPRPAEAPWQVASWCDEASSRRQVVLTVCVGKAWWPNCATVLRFSLVLMYRACKLTRGEGEDDRTENKPKIRKVACYRRFSPVLERQLAAQVELDGQLSGLAAS